MHYSPAKSREDRLTAFQQELAARLAALDRGDGVDPAVAREFLRKKSQERRKLTG